ncbi:MAG TPA: hypothetical protein VK190_02640 [Pseudoneobacillus sp.]|nr:hypothetical protein [Pseudoneobacillus sp.]
MKDLSSTLKEITKKYGAGAVMTLDANNLEPIECTPTGVLAVDLALGGKGLPNGRIVE